MGLQETKIESLPFVIAELNYLAPVLGKPRTYAFDPPPGEPQSTSLPEPHRVPIFDARLIAQNFSLDREGFALVRHPHRVRDFYNDDEIRSVYYPAVEAFLRATRPHRFYFPKMASDEALLLKCYHSATDGRMRFGPHAAFADPTTPADAAPRESIEVRTLFHKQ